MAEIKGTKDSYGNKILVKTTIDAVRTEEGGVVTLRELLPLIVRDISILVTTNGWITSIGEYSYYKDFAVTDILSTDSPIVMISPVNAEISESEWEAFNCLRSIETSNGSVRVYVNDIPETNVNIILKGVPNRSFTV